LEDVLPLLPPVFIETTKNDSIPKVMEHIPINEATIIFNESNARAAVEVIHDEDIPKPRLDIVDVIMSDELHLGSSTTKTGDKTIKSPQGNLIFTGTTIANLDENRYPDPCVCDPEENPDLSRLTGVNSVVFGESKNQSDPTICPGKEVASSTAMLTTEAKHEAESATAGDRTVMVHDTLAQIEIELPCDDEQRAKDDEFDNEGGIEVIGQMSFNGPKNITSEEEGVEVIGQTKFNGLKKVSPFGTIPLRHSTTCPIY